MRTFVLGDLHLTRHTPAAVSADLARLCAEQAGQRIIVAGDFFDLATDAPRADSRRAMDEVLGAHPQLRSGLGEFLDRGGQLVLLGGNHDAAVGLAAADLRDILGARAGLSVSPWFMRQGGLHVEHGHFYDPDNAPAHPLVHGEPSLGVHFSAEFLHPTGAHRYLQANDQAPLDLFLSAFRWYGARAPYVIYRYFRAALSALAKCGPLYRAHGERPEGQALLREFAADAGVPLDLCEAMLSLGPAPTLASFSATFARLYLDRVAATLALGAGLGGAAAGWRKAGAASFGLGSMLMLLSWVNGKNRYQGTVAARLAEAAEAIGETGAELVVFGHTHREALTERYANTGSFAFPRGAPGRPYLEIEFRGGVPKAVRRYLA